MTPEKIREICAALAKITGNQYTPEAGNWPTIAERDPVTAAMMCQISVSKYDYEKMARVWTSYPESVTKAQRKIGYFPAPSTKIGANPDRKAADLAADIARRLLPAARTDWGKMRENYHQAQARHEQIQSDMSQILAASPKIETRPSDTTPTHFYYYSEGIGIGGEVSSFGVTFERFHAPAPLAAKIMELVTAPQTWGQLQESINR